MCTNLKFYWSSEMEFKGKIQNTIEVMNNSWENGTTNMRINKALVSYIKTKLHNHKKKAPS